MRKNGQNKELLEGKRTYKSYVENGHKLLELECGPRLESMKNLSVVIKIRLSDAILRTYVQYSTSRTEARQFFRASTSRTQDFVCLQVVQFHHDASTSTSTSFSYQTPQHLLKPPAAPFLAVNIAKFAGAAVFGNLTIAIAPAAAWSVSYALAGVDVDGPSDHRKRRSSSRCSLKCRTSSRLGLVVPHNFLHSCSGLTGKIMANCIHHRRLCSSCQHYFHHCD